MENNKNIFFFFDTKNFNVDKNKNENEKEKEKEKEKQHYIITGIQKLQSIVCLNSIICVSDMGDETSQRKTNMQDKMQDCGILDNTEFKWITYKEDNSSDVILKNISEKYDFSEGHTLYILTNSGLRNNVMFFSTFTQIMLAKGLKTELIYVTQGNDEIRYVTDDNKYFKVLKAVELFVQSGNPKVLKEIYDKNKELKKLLSYMDNFYKNIQICRPVSDSINIRTSAVESKNIQICRLVNQSDILYNKMINEVNELMNKDIAIEIKLLLPTIKEKFMPLGTGYDEPLLQILKWCQNNDMLLTGYFIMDAEYKKFLYDKKIVQFIDNKFPSSDIIYNSKTIFDRKYSYLDDKDKYENIIKKQKMTSYDISNCLKFIFQRITNMTLDKKSKYFIDLRNSNGYKNIGQSLKELGIKPCNNDNQNRSLYELILLQDLIRNLRNNMAHSDNSGIIRGRYNICVITDMILKKYQKKYPDRKTVRIYNGTYKANDYAQPTEDIIFDNKGVYDILKIIFEISIDIIKENIEIIKGKAK